MNKYILSIMLFGLLGIVPVFGAMRSEAQGFSLTQQSWGFSADLGRSFSELMRVFLKINQEAPYLQDEQAQPIGPVTPAGDLPKKPYIFKKEERDFMQLCAKARSDGVIIDAVRQYNHLFQRGLLFWLFNKYVQLFNGDSAGKRLSEVIRIISLGTESRFETIKKIDHICDLLARTLSFCIMKKIYNTLKVEPNDIRILIIRIPVGKASFEYCDVGGIKESMFLLEVQAISHEEVSGVEPIDVELLMYVYAQARKHGRWFQGIKTSEYTTLMLVECKKAYGTKAYRARVAE